VGIPKIDDFNRGDNEGVSYFEVNQKRGSRWNTAQAFLHPIIGKRPNLTVMTHTQVTKILLEGSRVKGIQYFKDISGDQLEEAHAGELVLATGAVGSPQILMLSGIGPGDHLKTMGIQVKHELPGVGENLQDHLQVWLIL